MRSICVRLTLSPIWTEKTLPKTLSKPCRHMIGFFRDANTQFENYWFWWVGDKAASFCQQPALDLFPIMIALEGRPNGVQAFFYMRGNNGVEFTGIRIAADEVDPAAGFAVCSKRPVLFQAVHCPFGVGLVDEIGMVVVHQDDGLFHMFFAAETTPLKRVEEAALLC